ncbi:hypothetical protein HMPREF1544_08862 [Mucor circinelloides 1006PhL]|uniref:Uncharacterized protein n=1 Tax=Mucor circinelloides f. circinelloides (strain 1006PhL) TaxID=1220926 RepID=S2JP09_MUCC1|nr:hypothetical protein HMPREF1544_08862 [Mucor circinelloides 1006PhL]
MAILCRISLKYYFTQSGYNLRTNNEDWYRIEQTLATSTTTTVEPIATVASTTTAVSLPIPLSSPTLQSPLAINAGSVTISNTSSRNKSKSSLGTPVTELQKEDALSL